MHKTTQKKIERMQSVHEFLDMLFQDEDLVFHHRVLISDPMSRMCSGIATPYKGKWGEGVKADVPFWGEKTNRQHYRYYFIFKGKEGMKWPKKPETIEELYRLY